MKTPSFLAPLVEGNSLKRLFQGLVAGIICTMTIGFGWGGWMLGSTAEKMVEAASETAMVTALAPVCADKFVRAVNTDNGLVPKLAAVSSWERGSHLLKAGWATAPGGAKPDDNVAEACANLLNKTFKLK